MTLAFQISRQVRREMHQAGGHQHGLEKVSPYQLQALFTLQHHAGTMGGLAEEMNISLPSATALVDRLVKGGWVERQADPEDRRVTRLTVTAQGASICKRLQEKRYRAFKYLLDAMPENDIKSLQRILANLHQALEARPKQETK